jgi:hypothetical protein
MDKKCNGWSNYATWRVNLEICDDAINALALDGQKFDSVYEFKSFLEEEVENALTEHGEVPESLTLDYARAFVSDVDFYEIAISGIESYPELIVDNNEEDEDEGEESWTDTKS